MHLIHRAFRRSFVPLRFLSILFSVLGLGERHEQSNETPHIQLHNNESEPGALCVALFSHEQRPGSIRNPHQELTDLSLRQVLGGLDFRRGRDRFDEKVRVHQRVND